MILSPSKKTNRTIPTKYHIVFWVTYFLFNLVRWGSYFNDYWYSLKSNLVEFPLHIILVYANIYFFVPLFLTSKKYVKYIVFLFISLGIAYFIKTGLTYFLVSENIWPEAEGYQEAFTFNHVVAVVIGELYVIALATAIKLTVDWISQKEYLETLQKERLKSELQFLRAQIQPHFFFNTLNILYALTLEKSDKASEVVLKLSDIMQYVLYDVQDAQVSLLKELEYIHNYLDLEELRYRDGTVFKLNVEGSLEDVKVPPLLFLSFLENSIKHGAPGNDDFYVNMSFKREESHLLFSLSNSYVKQIKKTRGGIGNSNLKRRLDLLYQENYKLDVSSQNDIFSISLLLPI